MELLNFRPVDEMLESTLMSMIDSMPEFKEGKRKVSVLSTLFDKGYEIRFCIEKLGIKHRDISLVVGGTRYTKIVYDDPVCDKYFKNTYRAMDPNWCPMEYVIKKNHPIKDIEEKNLIFISPESLDCDNSKILKFIAERTTTPRIAVGICLGINELGEEELRNSCESLCDCTSDVIPFKIVETEEAQYGFCARF